MEKISNLKLSVLVGTIFFIAALLTLTHYGINWDTINHLTRGQTYLHYFLTKKTDYSDLEKFQRYFQDPDQLSPAENSGSRSFYQNDASTFDYFMQHDGDGHPPLSDILASVFNRILFGKLHLINDIDSYRVYGILLASITVGLICYWVSSQLGKLAGLVSAVSLSLYPLYWSESHFNTEKDIPETAYWSLFLFSFFQAITKKSWKWMIVTGIFFGLALGTKFNIFFAIFIIGGWFFVFLLKNKGYLRKQIKLIVFSLIIPIIGFTILILSWPYLWQDIVFGFQRVFGFYKTIGTTVEKLPANLYAIKWIIYTTPPAMIILFILGIIYLVKNFKKDKNLFLLLTFLWLVVPIARVSLPNTVIYGGVRQIMEYIPALSIFVGVGASFLVKKFKGRKFISSIVLIIFSISLLINIFKIHPNENVYFNFLIGGLKGAKDQNITSWGNSFGAAYRQAVSWINKNAEEESSVVLTYELLPNIPEIWFRRDITYHNTFRSGYLMNGEYALTLTYQGLEGRSYYDNYLDKFLLPVYEGKSDEVPIVKVWKNDRNHLINSYYEKQYIRGKLTKSDTSLLIDLKKTIKLSRLEANYSEQDCKPLTFGFVKISTDGENWEILPGTFPEDWRISFLGAQPKDGHFIEPFIGQNVRYIHIELKPEDTCLFKINNFKIFFFDY